MNHLQEIGIEMEIGMTVETIQQTTTGIGIEVSLTLDMEEVEEENITDLEQVKEILTRMNSVIIVT